MKVEAEKKLIDLLREIKLISTKGWTKNLVNGYTILNGEKYFSSEDGTQNYVVFQPVLKYFKPITNNMVMVGKSVRLSDESIKPPSTTGYK